MHSQLTWSTGFCDQIVASNGPDILCHTEKIALGNTVAGLKNVVASTALNSGFYIPTSIEIARRLDLSNPVTTPTK